MWRGWAGALCLSFSPYDAFGFPGANKPHPHQDRHKALTSTQPFPLSLQDDGHPFPHSVVKVHQEEAHTVIGFGRQTSSRYPNSAMRHVYFVRIFDTVKEDVKTVKQALRAIIY